MIYNSSPREKRGLRNFGRLASPLISHPERLVLNAMAACVKGLMDEVDPSDASTCILPFILALYSILSVAPEMITVLSRVATRADRKTHTIQLMKIASTLATVSSRVCNGINGQKTTISLPLKNMETISNTARNTNRAASESAVVFMAIVQPRVIDQLKNRSTPKMTTKGEEIINWMFKLPAHPRLTLPPPPQLPLPLPIVPVVRILGPQNAPQPRAAQANIVVNPVFPPQQAVVLPVQIAVAQRVQLAPAPPIQQVQVVPQVVIQNPIVPQPVMAPAAPAPQIAPAGVLQPLAPQGAPQLNVQVPAPPPMQNPVAPQVAPQMIIQVPATAPMQNPVAPQGAPQMIVQVPAPLPMQNPVQNPVHQHALARFRAIFRTRNIPNALVQGMAPRVIRVPAPPSPNGGNASDEGSSTTQSSSATSSVVHRRSSHSGSSSDSDSDGHPGGQGTRKRLSSGPSEMPRSSSASGASDAKRFRSNLSRSGTVTPRLSTNSSNARFSNVSMTSVMSQLNGLSNLSAVTGMLPSPMAPPSSAMSQGILSDMNIPTARSVSPMFNDSYRRNFDRRQVEEAMDLDAVTGRGNEYSQQRSGNNDIEDMDIDSSIDPLNVAFVDSDGDEYHDATQLVSPLNATYTVNRSNNSLNGTFVIVNRNSGVVTPLTRSPSNVGRRRNVVRTPTRIPSAVAQAADDETVYENDVVMSGGVSPIAFSANIDDWQGVQHRTFTVDGMNVDFEAARVAAPRTGAPRRVMSPSHTMYGITNAVFNEEIESEHNENMQ